MCELEARLFILIRQSNSGNQNHVVNINNKLATTGGWIDSSQEHFWPLLYLQAGSITQISPPYICRWVLFVGACSRVVIMLLRTDQNRREQREREKLQLFFRQLWRFNRNNWELDRRHNNGESDACVALGRDTNCATGPRAVNIKCQRKTQARVAPVPNKLWLEPQANWNPEVANLFIAASVAETMHFLPSLFVGRCLLNGAKRQT